MAKVTLRGCRDDLVMVEGDLIEEFCTLMRFNEIWFLGFSDGTLVSISYTRAAVWRINTLRQGTAVLSKVEAANTDDDYSDVLTLEGELEWVNFGSSCAYRVRGM